MILFAEKRAFDLQYDDAGRRVAAFHEDENTEIKEIYIYKESTDYLEEVRLSTGTWNGASYSHTNGTKRASFEYDGLGRQTDQKDFDTSGDEDNPVFHSEKIFDAKGRIHSETSFTRRREKATFEQVEIEYGTETVRSVFDAKHFITISQSSNYSYGDETADVDADGNATLSNYALGAAISVTSTSNKDDYKTDGTDIGYGEDDDYSSIRRVPTDTSFQPRTSITKNSYTFWDSAVLKKVEIDQYNSQDLVNPESETESTYSYANIGGSCATAKG